MDYPRAREIFESPQVIQVKYRGRPVWIESIDQDTHTARVSVEKEVMTIPIGELRE
ncbi:MAG TPA: H-type small acid-soluble spore protein [Desulfotomaculum sp.]|nr:H-type small acid-soluble spore protein [Desulfotomaculum sp.]